MVFYGGFRCHTSSWQMNVRFLEAQAREVILDTKDPYWSLRLTFPEQQWLPSQRSYLDNDEKKMIMTMEAWSKC